MKIYRIGSAVLKKSNLCASIVRPMGRTVKRQKCNKERTVTIYKGLLFLGALVFSSVGLAAVDPVSLQVIPASGFPANTLVGDQSVITYRFTNNIPLLAPVTIDVSESLKGGGFTIHDNCKNKALAHGKSCDVSIAFHPTHPHTSSLQVSYTYNHNVIKTPALTAKATAPANGKLSGKIYGLPPVIYTGSTPTFRAEYINNSDVDLTGCAVQSPVFIKTGSATASLGGFSSDCGTTLPAHHTCQVSGKVTSVTGTGSLQVQGNLTCSGPHGGASASPKAAALVKNNSSCSVTGAVLLPLPIQTFQYADNMVKFEFSNPCSSKTLKLGPVSIQSSTPATVSAPAKFDGCSNKSLAPQTSCFVSASVIPQNTASNMTVTASVTAGNTARAHTSTKVQTHKTTTHHVQFVNQCGFSVWYGIANGKGGNFTPDPNLKKYPGGAPSSAYHLPAQVSGKAPAVIDLTMEEYLNGALWARTGCKMASGQFVCATGTCATLSGSATCVAPPGTLNQPIAPFTKFEFTIMKTAGKDGVYDVSIINGMNVPVAIKAFGPHTPNSPFNCTGVGSLIQPDWFSGKNVLGSCPWRFNPASALSGLETHDFLWVTPGAQDGCSSGANCGRAFDVASPANPSKINQRQGKFLGYSTLANYAGYALDGQWGTPNLFKQYGIGSTFPAGRNYGDIGGSAADWKVLFECTPTSNNSANTCYPGPNPTNVDNCCGCVDWQDEPAGSSVRTAARRSCAAKNPDWTTINPSASTVADFNIKKGILWLKEACPTAYSYQFDDPSAGANTCNLDGQVPLMTSYQITFCPGGEDSRPQGVTEGRATAP